MKINLVPVILHGTTWLNSTRIPGFWVFVTAWGNWPSVLPAHFTSWRASFSLCGLYPTLQEQRKFKILVGRTLIEGPNLPFLISICLMDAPDFRTFRRKCNMYICQKWVGTSSHVPTAPRTFRHPWALGPTHLAPGFRRDNLNYGSKSS